MQLVQILSGFIWFLLKGSLYTHISGICNDSRQVSDGDVFICIRGAKTDGHEKIDEALQRGAAAIITDHPVNIGGEYKTAVVQTPDTRLAEAKMAAAFYGYPAKKLSLIGITGTKGKTTTAYMLKNILEEDGKKTGLIGTVEIFDGEKSIKTKNTTPGAITIHKALAQMVKNGVSHAVMEVSSQGLKQSRIAGLYFDVGIMTNISRDHIGKYEHADMQEYMFYKSLLFRQCSIGLANAGDALVGETLKNYQGRLRGFLWQGEKTWLSEEKIGFYGSPCENGLTFLEKDGKSYKIELNMPGDFNRVNALGAASAAVLLKVGKEAVCKGLSHVYVSGRMEIVPVNKPVTVIIDYAHNAAALKSLLEAVRPMCRGRLICMFGCGGNRSGDRRFQMGKVSAQMADLTVITSDNPRFEPPMSIIREIARGADDGGGTYKIIEDRKEAVSYCVRTAQKGDIVVLAGKGHEDYQEINGIRYPMNEKSYLKAALAADLSCTAE